MSKLAELLQSRGVGAATPATPATQEVKSSKSSESSRGAVANLTVSLDLENRIRAMTRRWRYTPAELVEVLDLARTDPDKWTRAVTLDESKEAEFRDKGMLPKVDA